VKASPAERHRFLQYKALDLQQYVLAVERSVENHGKNSWALRVAHRLNPLFETMNRYAPIAQTMIQADPTSSSLILGGITCIMSISKSFADYQEKMGKMLSEMLEKLDILTKYGENIYKKNEQMQRALMNVYGDILDFCVQASRLFLDDKGKPRNSFRTFVTSLAKPFESKFSGVLSKFDKHIKDFEENAMYVDRERQEVDRRRMDSDREVASQFIQHQMHESNQIHKGVDSIWRQVSVVSQRQQEEIKKSRAENLQKQSWGLPPLSKHSMWLANKITEEKRRKVIAWIPSIPFREEQQGKYKKLIGGTGEWILKDETYEKWEAATESKLLWVHGKNGSGKSCLAASVVQHLIDSAENANKQTRDGKTAFALAYVFPTSLVPHTIDHSKLVGSILSQLCQYLPEPEIEESLETLFDRQDELPTRQEMQKSIFSIAARFPQTLVVVDGLDECHKLGFSAFQEFCELISSLIQPKTTNSVTKVIAFSRPEYLEIKKAFGDCLKIQVDKGKNDDDIREFIVKEFTEKDLLITKTPELIKEAETTLLFGANGMFLWVDLLVKTLRNSRSTNELKAKLKALPKTLEEAYDKSLRRVIAQEDEFVRARALKILLWTANAKRALSREELKEALAIEPDMTDLDQAAGNKIETDDGFAAECGDLVYLADDQYHLLHSSLKDYLVKKLPASKPCLLDEYISMQKDAARILAETCLTYLSFESFKSGPTNNMTDLTKMLEERPFFRYAASYWGYHVAEADVSGLLELVKRFLSSDGARELSMQCVHLDKKIVCPYPGKTTPLHLLSFFDIVEAAKEWPDAQSMYNARDGFYCTPFDYALTQRSKRAVDWLLEKIREFEWASIDNHIFAVHVAAYFDWADVVERLLSSGSCGDAKTGERQLTPLHAAAIYGSESTLKLLLKANFNVDSFDIDGTTPLIDAAEADYSKLVTLLLAGGASVNIRGRNGTTALHHAAANGNVTMVTELLQKGAEVDSITSEGWSFRTSLHVAAENDFLEILELLIEKGADIDKRGPDGFTALLLACSSGSRACLQHLLKAGAQTDLRTDMDTTCFHVAAANGHSEILEILFNECIDRDFVNSADNDGDTPLMSALRNGKKVEAQLLLDHGAPVNTLNKSGQSALQIAMEQEYPDIAELLVARHEADVTHRGRLDSPMLHYASHYGYCNLISTFLQAGSDPDEVNEYLDTALHLAARANNLDFIKKLLKEVPTLNLVPQNNKGNTPLHLAASEGFSEIVAFFLRQASISDQIRNIYLDLPLHFAALNGQLDIVKQLVNRNNVNTKGYSGRTALHSASYGGYVPLVEYLLQHGADPNILDDLGYGPIYASITAKNDEVANILLRIGASPNAASKYDETPLHKAAEHGNEYMVKKLLDAEGDGLHASKWGTTPFMFAVESGKLEVVDAFLDHGFDGVAITDDSGKTCIHVAASKGNVEMLKRLTMTNKQIALATNCMGSSALDFAAWSGQTNMIEPLRDLGLDMNGSEGSWTLPLLNAASEGYYDFVCRLLELGADVNKRAGLAESTPLHGATSQRRPLTAERLLKAGADPMCLDAFGLSPMDYASRDPIVWEKMRITEDPYSPTKMEIRLPILRNTVQKCVKLILDLPQERSRRTEFKRLGNLGILASALFEMRTEQSLAHAVMCYIELASPPDLAYFFLPWICDMCGQTRIRGSRYLCKSCNSTCFCSECYLEFVKGDSATNSTLRGLKVLQELEHNLKPIRELLKISLKFGAEFLAMSCQLLVVVIKWIDRMLKEYEEWEGKYNATERFGSYKRPGQELLKIIKKASKINEDKEKLSQDAKQDAFTKIEGELAGLYDKHKPDKELARLVCSGHEYIEVHDKNTMTDSERAHFDTDGKLTAKWLSELLDSYQNNQAGSNAEKQKEPHELPNPAQPASQNVKEHQSHSGFEMSLLTDVITDEPTEIGPNTNVAGEQGAESLAAPTNPPEAPGSTHQHEPEIVAGSVKISREQSSFDKTKLETQNEHATIRGNPNNEMSAIEEVTTNNSSSSSANLEKIRVIQGTLRSDVLILLDLALKVIIFLFCEGRKGNSTNEDSNSTRDKDNGEQNVFLDRMRGRSSNTHILDDSWKSEISTRIMILETAWNLAQIVLIGSVKNQLVESLENIDDDDYADLPNLKWYYVGSIERKGNDTEIFKTDERENFGLIRRTSEMLLEEAQETKDNETRNVGNSKDGQDEVQHYETHETPIADGVESEPHISHSKPQQTANRIPLVDLYNIFRKYALENVPKPPSSVGNTNVLSK